MRSIEQVIRQSKSFRNEYHKASVNLIYSGKWIINLHNELFHPFRFTLQQYNILRILKGQLPKAATVKLIQERMIDKASDASRIVEVLRKKGMVQRNDNHQDRRRVDVLITPKGISQLAEIEKMQSKKMDNLLSNLDQQEIQLLNSLLDKARG